MAALETAQIRHEAVVDQIGKDVGDRCEGQSARRDTQLARICAVLGTHLFVDAPRARAELVIRRQQDSVETARCREVYSEI